MDQPAARGRLDLLLAALLVVAVGAIYGQTARHGFITYDDGAYITENPHVTGGLNARDVRWAFTEFHSANWHPLTWLSHQLDVELFGLDAGKHHLVGAGLHALSAVLLLVFLLRATGARWPAFLVALAFAVHPLRVESVAWASERKDLLSGVFFFLTLLAHLRHVRAPGPRNAALVALCLALGLMAKPMLVTVPVVLLVVDRWPLGRREPLLRLALEKAPLFALAAASSAVTWFAQRAGGAVRSVDELSLLERCSTAILGTKAYLVGTLVPRGLAFFYPHPALVDPEGFSPLGIEVLASLAGLLALTWSAWRLRGRAPSLAAGWAWTLVMLLPVIGIVQVGAQLHADRYVYLPLVGLTAGVVYGVRALAPSTWWRPLWGLGLAHTLVMGTLAFRQTATWRDDVVLATRALAVTERNFVAEEHLALALQNRRDFAGARDHYLAALAIAPLGDKARGNLGAVYVELGEREKAVEQYRRALEIAPHNLDARLNWGVLYEREGDHATALQHYDQAVARHPDAWEAWLKRGDALTELGRLAEALEAYGRALDLDPGRVETLVGRALARTEAGQGKGALEDVARALRLDPGNARTLHAEAWARATCADPAVRDPARALAILQGFQGTEAARDWRHLRVLAAALAAAGRSKDAALAAAEASARAPKHEWDRLARERELYAAGGALRR